VRTPVAGAQPDSNGKAPAATSAEPAKPVWWMKCRRFMRSILVGQSPLTQHCVKIKSRPGRASGGSFDNPQAVVSLRPLFLSQSCR
jgi:hypothetical protein